ncbi:HEAT repeat domain-containing protein [Kitasatospora sp. NPDC057692]|uniref:HEAT repeat domain-containing protein n=1 Tax=Kitasatospora sp. NPDC057692 TaxID=3346215 RepID=UPI003684B9F0
MKRSDDLLAGLDDIDWSALRHAYGSAEDVPGQLRAACGPDEKARESSFSSLFGNIFHQGTRYSASPYAVPFLTRIAVAGPADARINALLLTRLAVDWHDEYDLPLGIDTAAWRTAAISPEENLRWYDEQIAAETDEERLKNLGEGRKYCAAGHPVDAREGALRSYDAVRAQLPALLEPLDDPDPEIRTRTAYLLGWFPEEADTTLPPLLARLDSERNPACVATVLVAVGLLTDHDPDGRLRRHLDHRHPLPRWAAATALTRLMAAHPTAAPDLPPAERIAAELAAFDAGPIPEAATAHHAGDLHSYTVRSLLCLMDAAEDPDGVLLEIVRTLPRIVETGVSPRPLAARADNLLKALFEPSDTVPVFAELSQGRRELLTVLAELLTAEDFQSWPFGSDLHERFTRYGLPGTRPALRAYVGLPTEGEDPNAPLADPWAPFRDR